MTMEISKKETITSTGTDSEGRDVIIEKEIEYDEDGNITKVIEKETVKGNSSSSEGTSTKSRILSTVTNSNNSDSETTTVTTYDSDGNITSVTVTSSVLGARRNQIVETTTNYDSSGNVVSTTTTTTIEATDVFGMTRKLVVTTVTDESNNSTTSKNYEFINDEGVILASRAYTDVDDTFDHVRGSWSLVDLILAALSLIFTIVKFLKKAKKNKNDDSENEIDAIDGPNAGNDSKYSNSNEKKYI